MGILAYINSIDAPFLRAEASAAVSCGIKDGERGERHSGSPVSCGSFYEYGLSIGESRRREREEVNDFWKELR